MGSRKRDTMTFKVGDKVRVTPEYTAWYRETTGKDDVGITPDTDLRVYVVEDDITVIYRRDDRRRGVRIIPPEYLVSAEPDHTAAVIEAARKLEEWTEIEDAGNCYVVRAYLPHAADYEDVIESTYRKERNGKPPSDFMGVLASVLLALKAYDAAHAETESEG